MTASRLARPELAPLVDELARRYANGDNPVSLTLRAMPDEARRALADLLGLDRLPRAEARVPIARLVTAVGFSTTDELRAAVDALRGPLPDRRAERSADQAARSALWQWFAEQAAGLALGDPAAWTASWVNRLRDQGARGGVEVHRRRLDAALRVLRALPADGVSLAAFADDHLNDPHALDRGRRLASIVLDAVALSMDLPLAGDAEGARRLWEAVGVAPDPLSSTVLVLGLRGAAAGPLARWLAAAAEASEPVVLTLALLRRWPVSPLPTSEVAYVVENPSVIAEAARQRWGGPPIVCSSGRPTVAVSTLLRQLGAEGAAIRQHADFDSAGLSITAWLAARAGTTPWRMTAVDYLAAAGYRDATPRLLGSLPPTPWDPGLQEAMQETGVVVYEERLRADLLDWMRRS
jgi:uncharacterized protein (TIGR02679 family)